MSIHNDFPLLSVRVARKTALAQDIVGLELRALDGAGLPAFEAGAHIDLILPNGLVRQYSLLPQPDQAYGIAVLREEHSRGGSLCVHDQVAVGDILQISALRNLFPLEPEGFSVLFAGGIGITPLLSMARRLKSDQRDFVLHYSCRNQQRAAFLDELQDLAAASELVVHYDDRPETALDVVAVLRQAPPGAHFYLCGPVGYVSFLRGIAAAVGIAPARIHIESFSPQGRVAADMGSAESASEDSAFEVELASTGEVFEIPADESITSALERQGVYIPVSCEQGICGTCLTGVSAGLPEHRDSYLTDEEHAANDQFTPCVSRARSSRLVLDL